MQSKLYNVRNIDSDQLMAALEHFFHMQAHQVQVLRIGGGLVLQAQKESTFSTLTGQSSALTIKVMTEEAGTRVEIGSSKWIDKAAVGVLGYVIMPVLAIFPIIGLYNQYKLGEEAWKIIDAFMAQDGAGSNARPSSQRRASRPAPPPPQTQDCLVCGNSLAPNAAFCSSCGAPVAATPICAKCGTTNQRNARFCSGCGHRFEGAP